ncbi:hypothetical protein Poly51_61910 [Rubripirellula tenax]|uniref:Secreted protein n=1 Tax=Rubripirellula tenax TaxID=2528015 RepID=A0A5C6E8Z8_9BACT|nr:hypothetical protein Poly51_61910 [Rubripirellula tenax]
MQRRASTKALMLSKLWATVCWAYAFFQSDNGRVLRAGTLDLQAKNSTRKPGSVTTHGYRLMKTVFGGKFHLKPSIAWQFRFAANVKSSKDVGFKATPDRKTAFVDVSRITVRFSGTARRICHFNAFGSRSPLQPMVPRFLRLSIDVHSMSQGNGFPIGCARHKYTTRTATNSSPARSRVSFDSPNVRGIATAAIEPPINGIGAAEQIKWTMPTCVT